MVEPLKDELLSAYLDDALSVADRDRVERHLAANPEDRQLVDELRVLRESFQSLPRHELPATFRDKVLRQAERAMLTQPVEAPAASQANAPRRPKWLPVGDYRTLAWPAAVLAVAIMLMVVYREGPDKMRDVAQVDKPRGGAAEDESGGRRTEPEIRSRVVDESGSEMVETPQLEENLASEGLARENLTIAAKQPAGRPLGESSPAAPRKPAAAGALAPTPRITVKTEERVEPKSSAGSSRSQTGKARLGGMQHTAERYAGSKFGSSERGLKGAPEVDSMGATGLPANQPFFAQSGLGRGILLVQVDVSRRAAKARAFEKLLERQQIVLQKQFAPQKKFDQPAPTERHRRLDRSTDEAGSRDKKTARKELALSESLDRDRARPVPEGVEMFYAEATESQVQAALEDLDKRDDEFPTLTVQPDPNQPRQARFGTFQRGRQGEDWQHDFAEWWGRTEVNPRSWAYGSGAGAFGGGRGQKIAAGLAGEDGVDERGEAAGSSSAAVGAGLGLERAKGEGQTEVPKGPLSGPGVARHDEKATEAGAHLAERDSNRSAQVDRERGEQAKQSAAEDSRGSYAESFRRKRQAGQQVQEADGQHASVRQGVQQAPAAAASEGQLGRSQASPGRGGRGRPPAMGEARPLQIVFLLRVVDAEPEPTAAPVPDAPK